jgi:hypothetical protein
MKSAGYDVDILTYNKTEFSKSYSEIKDINNEYDYLFAYNGPINFYAGAICESMINNFLMMNKWKKPIHYLYNDPNLPWKPIWPGMRSKSWNTWKEEDVKVASDLIILSNMMESDYKVGKAKHKNIDNKTSFHYFPFNEWILYGIENPGDIKNTAECDLIYGGSFRGGNRERKMIDYFFDKNKITVNLFGTIKLDKFDQEQIKVLQEANINAVCSQGEVFLNNYIKPINIAYLDNFDWTWEPQQMQPWLIEQIEYYRINHGIDMDNVASQTAHLLQTIRIEQLATDNSLIVFDDTWYYREWAIYNGKGGSAVHYLLGKGYEVLHTEEYGTILGRFK